MTDIVNDDAGDEAARFDPAAFWSQFHHGTAVVAGVRLHYVEGGSGRPMLLIPGWPQSWFAWRLMMPLLAAAGRRVIALDPRGIGDSDRPVTGYDMGTVAAEIHGFIHALGLQADGGLDVVGHDIGTWISYALAADWPGDVKRLVVMDAALPGVSPPAPAGIPTAEANLKSWHFAFNRLDDLPEVLITGRERAFLSWLFQVKSTRMWRLGQDGLDEYTRVLSAPGALRTALAYYRTAFGPAALAQSRARAERKLTIPVLALGAETGVGGMLVNTMQLVAGDVAGGALVDCGHYMPEERPATLAQQVLRFMPAAG